MPYTQRFLLGFCAGAMILGVPWRAPAELPLLLAWLGAAAAGALALLALLAALRPRPAASSLLLTLLGVPVGLAWSGAAHDAALGARLADAGPGAVADITGRVLDPPATVLAAGGLAAQRFRVLVMAQHDGAPAAVGRRLRLSWYGGEPVAQGEVWRWRAVLQGPWSYANPGGFDYERWLLGAGLQGTGYVRAGTRQAEAEASPLRRLRQSLGARLESLAHRDVLQALLLGDSGEIPQKRWNDLRATGTVHLMVISGLHVSLAAALGFGAGRWGVRLCPPLLLWVDARLAGCLAGGLAALLYVLLAGAGLPALRALVMSAATLVLLARGRTGRLGGGLLLALASLLASQPLAVHQQGFWLSFGAVAILYLSLGHRHGRTPWWRTLLRAQLTLSLGMLPLIALTTDALPWMGIPANLVAVPVMSGLVVPALLLAPCAGVLSGTVESWLLQLADVAVGGVLAWLEWLAQVPLPAATGGAVALLAAQAAALWWVAGCPRHYRPALLLCGLLPLATPVLAVPRGEFRVTALDVGQGEAVVVDTRRHRLVYDSGPGFPSGFETGSAVVVPSVLATGPPRLDALVLSHDDLDHVGGAAAVTARLRPLAVLAPDPGPHGGVSPDGRCHGRRWRWDGVTFRLLDVPRPPGSSDNDRSCILSVDNGRRRMLIAGDVSARVESSLLRALDAPRQLDLLFAPHHGSLSSSSPALVRVLRPAIVIASAARNSRFGHPHPRVVARYRQMGARLHQTGVDGALVWQSDAPAQVVGWRRDRAPYWRGRPAACGPPCRGAASSR